MLVLCITKILLELSYLLLEVIKLQKLNILIRNSRLYYRLLYKLFARLAVELFKVTITLIHLLERVGIMKLTNNIILLKENHFK